MPHNAPGLKDQVMASPETCHCDPGGKPVCRSVSDVGFLYKSFPKFYVAVFFKDSGRWMILTVMCLFIFNVYLYFR